MTLNASDLRNMTKDELDIKLSAIKVELFKLRGQATTGRIEKPHTIQELKRDIARIKTVLKEIGSKNVAGTQKT